MNEKPQTIRLFVFKILHDKQHSCRIECSMDGFSSFFAILMLCAGLFLSVRINFFQFTHLGCAIKTALGLGQRRAAENLRRKQKSDASGVTPFQALSSALGGSIGTANIAGVASAIAIGGAGAVFYMWLAALVGMGVKFCEIVLALRYREKRGGQWCGGAMLYIEKGFRKSNTGSRFLQSVSKPLAAGFALFGLLASSVGTPLVQSNTIAMSVNDAVLLFLPKAEQKTVCIIAGAATAAAFASGVASFSAGDTLSSFSAPREETSSPASPIKHTVSRQGTTSPSSNITLSRVPEKRDFSSNADLSVSYENSTSPSFTASPGFLCHAVMMQDSTL